MKQNLNVSITKSMSFEAGHRLHNHVSACRNLHGHHYVLEVTVSGAISHDNHNSTSGMVADFSEIKKIMKDKIVEPWDHAFLVYQGDPIKGLIEKIPEHKTIVLPFIPTVENLASEIFRRLEAEYFALSEPALSLIHVRLYETPTCWSDVTKQSS